MAGEERESRMDIAALKERLGKWATGKRQRSLILLLGALGVVLLAAPTLLPGRQSEPTGAAAEQPAAQTEDYAQSLARQLEDTLGHIRGVGEVRVMVTLEQQEEHIYATDSTTESRTEVDSNQSQSQQTHVILEQDGRDQPLVTTTRVPRIRGVLVVCAGGDDPLVQNDLTQAVTALLGIGPSRIAVSKMG